MATSTVAAVLRVLVTWLALETATMWGFGRLDPILSPVARATLTLAVWAAALLLAVGIQQRRGLRGALQELGITKLPVRVLFWPVGVLALAGFFHLRDGQAPGEGWPVRLVVMIAGAGISEELVFRSFLYRGLRGPLAVWPAALLSGVCFALAHLPLGAAVSAWPIGQMALALALSIPLALLWERGRSLWPCALLHVACDLSVPFPLSSVEAAGIENRLVLLSAWFVAIGLMRGGLLAGKAPGGARSVIR